MPIWTWLKGGTPKGFFANEESLLTSYDMIPLRGLNKAREDLNKKGRIASGTLVQTTETDLFVPYRNGEPDIAAINYGCHSATHDGCLRSLCSYVSFIPFSPKENRFAISEEDNMTLRAFQWRSLSTDKRRRRPLSRLNPVAVAILAGIGFQIKQVQFIEDK